MPAVDAVLLVVSVPDSFQSGALTDVLLLLRVGQPASFAENGKKGSINTRSDMTEPLTSTFIIRTVMNCIANILGMTSKDV